MDKLGRNAVNRKALPILLLILIALAGVGIIPLSLMGLQQHNLSLYYESSTASAPVNLRFYGSISEYGEWITISMIRGVFLGYRTISGSVTLKIGAHYEETITVKPTVLKEHKGSIETYSCSISAEFSVPASTVVPYMEFSEDTPDEGSSSFTASYVISISADPSDVIYLGETTGPVYIQIVGDVTDYVVEDPPGEDPPEEAPPEDLPLQDSKTLWEYGASELTSSTVSGFFAQISLSVLLTVTIIIAALFYHRRK